MKVIAYNKLIRALLLCVSFYTIHLFCMAHSQLNDTLIHQSFEFRSMQTTPFELYGNYVYEAYQKLCDQGLDYIQLLFKPEIVYRLDDFLDWGTKHKIFSCVDHVQGFLKSLGRFPEPPKSRGANYLLGGYPEWNKYNLDYVRQLNCAHGYDLVEVDIPCAGILTKRVFMVTNPEYIKQILTDTTGTYVKGDPEKRFQQLVFNPEGIIFMSANERWHLLNQALLQGPCNPLEFPNRYADIFTNNALWLIDRLSKNIEPFEMYQEMTYYTMRTMAEAFFDYSLNNDELVKVTDAFRYILDFMKNRETTPYAVPLFIPTARNNEFSRHCTIFTHVIKKIIKKAPRFVEVNGVRYPTIIKILQDHRDPVTNKRLSEQEIMSHVATLFFAGHDTTANFVTMLMYQLNKHTYYSAKIIEELNSYCSDRSVRWSVMDTLPEYTKFKNEVLRLYPSVPVISIGTTKKTKLGEYTIPKDCTLYIILSAASTNPLYYKNPYVFDPDRFDPASDNFTVTTIPNTLAFSFGPRRCLGQWFAQAEAYNLVAHFLSQGITFTFINDCDDIRLYSDVTGRPHRKIWTTMQAPAVSQQQHDTCYHIHDVPMKLVSIRYANQSGSIKTFRFTPYMQDRAVYYHPGDHIELFSYDSEGSLRIGHFSISSSPNDSDQWLEITTRYEQNGFFSELLHNNVHVGDVFLVRYPMDDGVRVSSNQPASRPLVLVSGGIGMAPMMSIIRYALADNWPGEIHCIHSSKNFKELPFYQELIDLQKNNSRFYYSVHLTEPEKNYLPIGTAGRIDEHSFDNISCIDQALIYICGRPEMCKTIAKLLETKLCVPQKNIHILSFGKHDLSDAVQQVCTKDEVARHNTLKDAWIIINGIVYDITSYLDHHPGFDIINDFLGKDATDAFNMFPHSARAKKLLHESDLIHIKGIV